VFGRRTGSKQVVDVFFVSIVGNALDVVGDEVKTDFHGLRVTPESHVFELRCADQMCS
jgi:hypothetical protein